MEMLVINQIDKNAPKIADKYCGEDFEPEISVLCLTFNHREYIGQCIEGVLAQRTHRRVEIIVHDDASTDDTRDILIEYRNRYPGFIKLVLQDENQFTKGNVVLSLGIKHCRGGFVAFCHGDDHWLSPYKLQYQHECLMKSKAGIVGNRSLILDAKNNEYVGVSGFSTNEITELTDKLVLKNSGNVVPYSSIMVNPEIKNRILENVPPVRSHTGLQILGSLSSGMLVLPYLFTVYRVNVSGSSTEMMFSSDEKKMKMVEMKIPSLRRLRTIAPSNVTFDLDRLLARELFIAPRSLLGKRSLSNYSESLRNRDAKGLSIFLLAITVEFVLLSLRFFVGKVKKLIF